MGVATQDGSGTLDGGGDPLDRVQFIANPRLSVRLPLLWMLKGVALKRTR